MNIGLKTLTLFCIFLLKDFRLALHDLLLAEPKLDVHQDSVFPALLYINITNSYDMVMKQIRRCFIITLPVNFIVNESKRSN
jgi:hypothetical protein